MTQKDFSLKLSGNAIFIESGNKEFCVHKAVDQDIWFETKEDKLTIDINFSSHNQVEYQTFDIFNSLMKSIVGRFILTGDDQNEYSILPTDFIDLETKTITWHSDSGTDNVLKIQYLDDIIRISINKASKDATLNKVRIRTDGSSYERYYQEFTTFYQQLIMLAYRFTEKEKTTTSQNSIAVETPNKQQSLVKKLSLHRLFQNKKQ